VKGVKHGRKNFPAGAKPFYRRRSGCGHGSTVVAWNRIGNRVDGGNFTMAIRLMARSSRPPLFLNSSNEKSVTAAVQVAKLK
jgi:hypothetical protein